MKIIRKIEDKTGKEIKHLYHEFMDMPKGVRLALDVALVAVLLFVLVSTTPSLKYTLKNGLSTANVKVKVVDQQTGLPIIDANVELAGENLKTDKKGVVELAEKEFGDFNVLVTKPGFDDYKSEYIFSAKQNTFEAPLKSNGKRVSIKADQYLSGTPVSSFVITTTDDQKLTAAGVDGSAVLVLPSNTALEVGAEVKVDGFVDQLVSLSARDEEFDNKFTFVPDGEHYFLATRGGATTIYKSKLDGGQQERLLEPTGFEGADSKLYLAPSGQHAVYEASRKQEPGKRQLYLVNTKTAEVKDIDSGAASWQIIDVSPSRVLYVYDRGDPSNNKNQTLKTYNFQTGESKVLLESPAMSFVSAVNGAVVLAEQVERGVYPGGYLLRQLLAIDEASGDVTKLSQDATVTDVRVATPTKIQYTQINPTTEAEVRFVYDTNTKESVQASVDRTAKSILKSPFEAEVYGWTIGATDLEFGDIEGEVTLRHSYAVPDLKIKQWVSKNYLILQTNDGAVGSKALLIGTSSGKSAPLP